MNKIVVGIDQSYQDTGITISKNGKVMNVIDCFTKSLECNSDKRKQLSHILTKVFDKVSIKASYEPCEVIVIIERIRLQSQGFINIDYIKSIGALNAMIVDIAKNYNYPVFSVDTRAWKSTIVGTSKELNNKYGIDPKKWPTILWCIKHGYENYIINYDIGKKKKGVIEKNGNKFTYNDNKADSICISLFGFEDRNKNLLKREN